MSIQFRQVTIDDAKLMFDWQTDPSTRKFCFNSNPPEWLSHLDWLEKSLSNPNRLLLMAYNTQPFGVVRFDTEEDTTEISVYLDPNQTKMKLGQKMIDAACQWLQKNKPEIKIVLARILEENMASQKAFEHCGFSKQHSVYTLKL